MDSYDDCPTCGRLVQQGRVCRYCAQSAGAPSRECATTTRATGAEGRRETGPRPQAEEPHLVRPRRDVDTEPLSPYGNGRLQPIGKWVLAALGVTLLAAIVAIAVLFEVL